MNEGINKTEDLWNSYKDLLQIITKHLTAGSSKGKTTLIHSEFESILRTYKQNFFSLLQNLPKSAKCREDLKKGMEDGISIRGLGHQVLSKELYQEAIILSDMYDLNEFIALDLLCTAQIQMSYYPGLPRGLVAVILYYDGRRALVSCLRLLVQAREGVAWSLKIPDRIEKFVTQFTNQLMENGLFSRIFELLKNLDLTKEIEMLQHNVALGGPKHRRQITDLFKSIRLILAETVFLWATQCGLPKHVTEELIHYLSNVKLEEEASGKIDDVTLYLQLALLAATDLSMLHTREDGEDIIQQLPIFAEDDYITMLLQKLHPNKSKWANEGLQAVTLFGFSICLSSLKLMPQSQQLQRAIEQEDVYIDAAIQMKVFEFMDNVMLDNKLIYDEEFVYKRIHNLFSDFIILMYSKVKELRIKADESARTMQIYVQEGLDAPSNLPRHFEKLLCAMAHFYQKDKLNLTHDFWAPMDNASAHGQSYRHPSRGISLFKFIRLAGDMLPVTLFVPFLKLLSGLSSSPQSARNCFNFIKQAGSALNGTMTWDHFFMSFNQYFNNLRQEVQVMTDTMYRHRSQFHKGITPQEIEGLHAVLLLIRTIADKDEFSRIALCEHPGWVPLQVLLGLVSCCIPIPLKADLLLTLAMLSKSLETAAQMWNNLETSQILVTIPSTSNYQPRGIQTDLDEVESRIEEYPLTRALLTLLDVLTDTRIPRTLGAGPRRPGFDPYLTFIVNSVFLKFNSRSYKNPMEKWQVASSCLKLFDKFVNEYTPDASDFPSNNKQNEFNSPPGFHIMVQMNTKSDFFNLLLLIIEEGNKLYDMHLPFSDESHIEKCTLHCLNIIERCLMLQNKFFRQLNNVSMPILLTQLSKLLLTLNPRSNKPDHVLNIAKYVSYQFVASSHTLAAVKILMNLTSLPTTHNQIMSILLSSNGTDMEIFHGFVECLDEAVDEDRCEVIINTKEAILTLLMKCLDYGPPNLTHFLLGFDIKKKDIRQTVFQLPGVMDFPRTCLHSLLALLRLRSYDPIQYPTLLETAYHLLYLLCSNSYTSESVLRLLRLHATFFKDHWTWCQTNPTGESSELNQLSWLMKVFAIELKAACKMNQIYHLKELTTMLVGLPRIEVVPLDEFDLTAKHVLDADGQLEGNAKENVLMTMLTKFDFSFKPVVAPQFEFFDNNVLNNLLQNCRMEGTASVIDVKKLHQILLDELSGVQGNVAMGQRQSVFQEVQKILNHAVEINNSNKHAAGIINFVNAWGQIIQVLSSYLPSGILSYKEQQRLNIEVLETVLGKATKEILLPDVANSLSAVVLILLNNMRKWQVREEKLRHVDDEFDELEDAIKSNAYELQGILNHLVQWILMSDVSAQKLKINLYGSLAIFLQLINVQEEHVDVELEDSYYVSRLDSSKCQLKDMNVSSLYVAADVLASYGEKLLEILCHDSASGQDVCKILSMTNFGQLINLTGNISWVRYIATKGFLSHIVQSILDSDKELRAVLEPLPENFRALYRYESKMTLLIRLASTKLGAELLLEHRLFAALSTMKVFDYHPDIIRQTQYNKEPIELSFVTPVEQRYLQLWLPSLNLCNAIIISLGSDNQSAVTQIMYFLISHLEVVELILRAGSPLLDEHSLRELSMLTGILSCTANNDLMAVMENNQHTPQDNRAYLYRIHKLAIGLLPKFILTEAIVRDSLCSTDGSATTFQTCDRLMYMLKIVCNLLMFARNAVENNGIDHSAIGVIFQPTLADSFNGYNGKGCRNINDHSPSLGTVVQHLINFVVYYHKEKTTLDFLNRKMIEIPNMNTIELKEVVFESQQIYDLNVLKESASETVSKKLRMKKCEVAYCTFAIEHCLYLIWSHLDYYMLKAIPRTKNYGVFNTSAPFSLDNTLASASEAMWKVSADDISNLKQGLISIFNDSFSRQLIETAQTRSESDRSLLEVLLRKIKRLIQFVPVK